MWLEDKFLGGPEGFEIHAGREGVFQKFIEPSRYEKKLYLHFKELLHSSQAVSRGLS